MASAVIYHESYGDVSRAQLAAYRRFNVSPSDHDTLVREFGTSNHETITKAVKELAARNNGYYNPGFRGVEEYARELAGEDDYEDEILWEADFMRRHPGVL